MTAASKMASEEDECECPGCGEQVYQAEAYLAANKKWHKRCYKCIGCNSLLSSVTCNVWQGNLFCKNCLMEVTRPKSPMLYADTTTVAQGDNVCPRCNGAVFQAEEIVEKGHSYHKRCFTCINCNRPQLDKLQVYVGFDHQIYCKTCYPKIWHTPLPLESRSKIKAEPGDDSGCPRCHGKVFEAEKMACRSGWYHKLCFSCKICKRLMDYSNFVDYKDDVLCKPCYHQHIDIRGYQNINTSSIQGSQDSFETCPRCSGIVYAAEKVGTKHALYHKSCLTCFDCNKGLDTSSFFDASDGQIYCKSCYSHKFGHRGRRAKSVGPVETQKIPANAQNNEAACPTCNGRVFEAERITAKCGWFHKYCFKCFDCNKLLDATNFFDGQQGGIFCNTCHRSRFVEISSKNFEYAKAVVNTSVISTDCVEDACPRCLGIVYNAEKMAMRSGNYHKKCFTCTTCRRNLDYLLAVDGPGAKDVYCKSCYIKNFGPSEQKYSLSSNTKMIIPETGSEEPACPRCKGAVYHAEVVLAKGKGFHKSCATCLTCSKNLDSLSLNTGPDGDIYCQSCHEDHFGSHRGHPYSAYSDVKITSGGSDDGSNAEKCIRCTGKVFDLEKITAGRSKLVFHKTCFNCSECKRSLDQSSSDSTRIYAFEPPSSGNNVDDQLPPGAMYCQRCHLEKFSDQSARSCNIWSEVSTIKDDTSGCPRCGGAVFQAEEVIEKGVSFHKKCFTCKSCSKPLNDKLQVYVGFDKEIYCKICYPAITHTPLPMDPTNRSKVKAMPNDPEACPRCLGKVFAAEKIQVAKDKCFHHECFTCFSCQHILSINTAQELQGEVFCQSCYSDQTSADGRKNQYMDRMAIQKVKADGDDDPDACVKCHNKVYENEKIMTGSGAFHKSCMSCFQCNRILDVSRYIDGRDGGIYCKNCYNEKYGYRGRRSQSRGKDVLFPAQTGDSQCPSCGGKIFDAEKFLTQFGSYHVNCFKCDLCQKSLATTQAFKLQDNQTIACKSCMEDSKNQNNLEFETVAKALIDTAKIKTVETDPDCCPRCSGKVFEAEKMCMKVGNYHRKCFSCCLCKRQLDLSLACDGPDDIFCNNCYFKNFGPVGVKYQLPSQTSVLKPGKTSDGCPRCGGAVFEFERLLVQDQAFHKSCATCKTCKRLLDSTNVCSAKLQDKYVEIFCQGCYSRFSGVAGFRGNLNTTWVDEKSSENYNSTWIDPSVLKSTNPNDMTCKKCQGIVFDLERTHAKGGIYHKVCFKCDSCSKRLDSMTSSKYIETQNDELLCVKCYEEKYSDANTAPNVYTETSKIISIDGTGCPRCGGVVYHAEEIVENGRCYHKQCFSCKACKRNLGQDRLNAMIGFDKEVYCSTCCPKVGLTNDITDTSKIKGEKDEDNTCPNCDGKVFEAERIKTSRFSFHRNCFKCASCSINLDTLSVHEDSTNGVIYCKNCYTEKYFTGGRNAYLSNNQNKEKKMPNGNNNITEIIIDPQACLNCGDKVYEMEKIQTRAGLYHSQCLHCHECQRQLEATSFLEARDKHIYCGGCYSSKYGVKSRGSSCGPINFGKVFKASNPVKACSACQGELYDMDDKVSTSFGLFHRPCFRCNSCSIGLETSPDFARKFKDLIFCRQCYDREFNLSKHEEATSEDNDVIADGITNKFGKIIPAADDDPDQCPNCKGKVFPAEMISISSKTYHRSCFNCCDCKRALDYSNACIGPNKNLFCNSCYNRYFGPLKRWFPEDKSFKTDLIMSIEGQGCPRCGGNVYEAEKVQASTNRVYHKKCCTCNSCNQRLDPGTLCNGSDQEIYCQPCHARKFGGASFRGSMAATWVDAEAASNMRPCQGIDPSKLKIENQQDSCLKCQGKVYDLERITSKSGVWHRQCFNCSGCKCNLTSTLDDAYDEQGQLYCKPCLKKYIITENTNIPMTYSDPKKLPAAKDQENCCNICQGAVFEAEKVAFASRVFHQGCFSCSQCKMKLDSLKAESSGSKVYCKTCYQQLEMAKLRPTTPKSSMITLDKSDPSACPRCGCKVFENEKMMSKNKVYHKLCFSCAKCNHILDYTNSMEGPNGEVYCKTCYVKEYFTGGRNKFCDQQLGPELVNADNDPEVCPKCHRKVYDIDKLQLSSHSYHKQCLTCFQCSRQLDQLNYFDATNRDGHIYCQNCYEAKFGVKGQATLQSDLKKPIHGDLSQTERCLRCQGNVFEAEKIVTTVGLFHMNCFKCLQCSRALDQASSYVSEEKEIMCEKCYKEAQRQRASSRSRSRLDSTTSNNIDTVTAIEITELNSQEDLIAQAMVETTTILADEGDENRCSRCNGKVFEAERMASNKSVFHKKCFTCQDCHRPLDSSLFNDGPGEDGLIFCNNCYLKRYGPTNTKISYYDEFKKNVDATTLEDSSLKNCHRCQTVVYPNEQNVTNGRAYHRACTRCIQCNRQLDQMSLFDAPDEEIYCSVCYNKRFSNSLKPDHEQNNGDEIIPIVVDVQPDDCIRCKKKVYDAEKMVSHFGYFHRTCYNCHDCHLALDSTKACELGTTKEIYCKNCYSSHLGLAGYGYGTTLIASQQIKQQYHFTQFF